MISMISSLIVGAMTSSCTSSLSGETKENVACPVADSKEGRVKGEKEPQKKATNLGSVSEISIEKIFELQQADSILLIDTRPTIFYKLGHIDGAHSLPLRSFEKSFMASKSTIDEAVARGREIVIYCQSERCKSSDKMAQALSKYEYNVSVFKGGWELWKLSGL